MVYLGSKKSCLTLANPWTVACQFLCPWDFPGRNAGVGAIPVSRRIPNAGIELCLLHLQVGSLIAESPGNPV